MSHTDPGTRERLVEAAGRLFAERGFRDVTVRQICQAADANVAAVNYHFGDKLGLYREVLERTIAAMQETTELARQAPGRSAEDRLRAHIRTYVERLLSQGGESWLRRLMSREIANPTPALDDIVERAIKPRLRDLALLVAEVMGCSADDPRVMRSVASIQVLCTTALPHPIRDRLGVRPKLTPEGVEAFASYVADFSVAGIRAVAASSAVPARGPKADAVHHSAARRPTGRRPASARTRT
jgi:AcrR family transcriptional regulator